MVKQEIVQILLVDGSLKVVFLNEEATTTDLIEAIVTDLDNVSIEEIKNWKAILLASTFNPVYQEVIEDKPYKFPGNLSTINFEESRFLKDDEGIFKILEQAKNFKPSGVEDSSNPSSDIHELSHHLHRPWFKVVNINDTIAITIKDVGDIEATLNKRIYIPSKLSAKNLIDILLDSLNLKQLNKDKNDIQVVLSLVKISLENVETADKIDDEEDIPTLNSSLKEKVKSGELKSYEFRFSSKESWYSRVGSMTSRITQKLARPFSVYTFFGDGSASTTPKPEIQPRQRVTPANRTIRHMSLSGRDVETGIDPSTITSWLSSDLGKPKDDVEAIEPNPNSEWLATYPVTRGIRHRERILDLDKVAVSNDSHDDIPEDIEQELTEIDHAFLSVLEELNIKEAERDKMMSFPPSKKLELIEQNEAFRRLNPAAKTPKMPTTPTPMSRPNSIVSQIMSPPTQLEIPNSAAQASLETLLSSSRSPPQNSTGLRSYLFGSLFSGSNNHPEGSVEYFIHLLSSGYSSESLLKGLQSLRITLSTATVTWVKQFLEDGQALTGIEVILEKIISKTISIANHDESTKVHDIEEDIHLECIRCLRVLLNTEPGFHEVLKHPSIISWLTFSINTTNDKLRSTAAEVLAAICVLSKDGHAQVLDALSDFRLKFHEDFRFHYLLDSLHTPVAAEGVSAIAAYEYKTTCLSFINAIVNSPESLDQRLLLREELRRRGLLDVFQDLKDSYPPESLLKQIECYEDEIEADKQDLKEQILFATLDEDSEHPLIKLSDCIKRIPSQSVTLTLVNQILHTFHGVLQEQLDDDLRYAILNFLAKLSSQIITFKQNHDWAIVLKNFFDREGEFFDIDARDILELDDNFNNEINKYKELEMEVVRLINSNKRLETDLTNLKAIPMVNYLLNHLNKEDEELDLTKTPKDNFTTLMQKLVQKEKEIATLNDKLEALMKPKDSGDESKHIEPEKSWSAIKEELEIQKEQNQQALSLTESRNKEIAYLKRSLEAVCTKFQLATSDYISDSSEKNQVQIGIKSEFSSDSINIPELQTLQRELELTQTRLARLDELEKENKSLKDSNSMLNLQVQEQSTKLAEKDVELKDLLKPKSTNSSPNPLALKISTFAPPPPPPPPSFSPTSKVTSPSISSVMPPPPPPPPPFSPVKNAKEASQQPDVSDASSHTTSPPPPPPPPVLGIKPLSDFKVSNPPPPPPPPGSLSPAGNGSIPPPPPPPPGPLSPTGNSPMPPPPPPPVPVNKQSPGFNINSPPPPPPTTTQHARLESTSSISLQDKFKPKVPMKALFWKKLANSKINGTVWEFPILHEEEILAQLDLHEFDDLFAKKVTKKSNSSGYSSIGKKIKGKKAITLLDLNRANNIAITLARVKMPFSAIKLAILEMDDSLLSIDNLRSLENHVPTAEEVKLVRSYTGPIEALGTAEKYILQIMDIPRLSERLNCMIFRRRFESDVEEIRPELTVLNRAIGELKDSEKLIKLLELMLAIGNYLNANTPRGEAKGFKLEILRVLKDVRATPNKEKESLISNLLNYLAWVSNDHWKELVLTKSELPHLEAAARISVATLINNIYSLTLGVKKLKAEISNHKKLELKSDDDKFIATMENFYSIASDVTASIKDSGDKLEANIEQFLSFFGEDSASTKLEDFFNLLITFLDNFEAAYQENYKLKEKQLKRNASNVVKTSGSNVKLSTFGQGDFDVAVRELRSGLRRKRHESSSSVTIRPRSGLFNLQLFNRTNILENNTTVASP